MELLVLLVILLVVIIELIGLIKISETLFNFYNKLAICENNSNNFMYSASNKR